MHPIFYLGEMRRLKGVDVLLEALALCRETTPMSLTLVGEGRDLAGFQRRTIELKLADSARFVGRKTMAEALPLGKTLVLPSRHESLPYVVLEAIAAKAPVVASNVGGLAEILPFSMLVPPGYASLLAQAMHAALNSKENDAQSAMLQSKIANAFTVQTMANQICAFYETVR